MTDSVARTLTDPSFIISVLVALAVFATLFTLLPALGGNPLKARMKSVALERDELRAKGAAILGSGEPRIGAHGVPVIFVHPKDMGGVLVELMETPKEPH